jgi:hypothetical protein
MLVAEAVLLVNNLVQAVAVVHLAETEHLHQVQFHLEEMAEQILAVEAAEETLAQIIIQVPQATVVQVLLS